MSTPDWGWVRSTRLRAALGLAVVLVLATSRTWAYWTDEAVVSGATFTAGTIDLKVNSADDVTAYTGLNVVPLVPGTSTAAVLEVKNGGTSPLKWSAVGEATNPDSKNLAGALVLNVTRAAAVTGSGSSASCTGQNLASSGALGGAVASSDGVLAPGTVEPLCVQLTLPSTAASGLQGATTTVTFTFTGTSDVS